MAVDGTRLGLLRWQLHLCWSLAGYHLPALTDELCLWEPAPGAWTVRRGRDGKWRPDWSEPEPDPSPGASVGWISWHLGWWWSEMLDHALGRRPPPREEVFWPGSATAAVDWITGLHDRWRDFLDGCSEPDLDEPFPFPWPEPRPLAVAAGWVNAELMKNLAEIGVLRHTWQARRATA